MRSTRPKKTYVNPEEVIPASAFGAEFLGWEPFSNFTARNEELNLPHIRWPGGLPVEEGINIDGSADGSREHVFDLKFDNLVEWDRNNGDPREGIKEMFAYANETGATFAMVSPTARYVEKCSSKATMPALPMPAPMRASSRKSWSPESTAQYLKGSPSRSAANIIPPASGKR
ncbi:hypothetical protein [Roseovarius sp.]|uniref:hypothetical protein n=1 Tax=Roseovarius sp. TaxID=1486281 RepID=UPI0035697AB3